MSHDLNLKETKKEWHGTLRAYLIGFSLSLILTSASFYLVISKMLSRQVLMYALIGLAAFQAVVQAIFFLHVGKEEKPRWETVAFFFTIMVVLIILLGTLWIMHDLDQRVMPHMGTHD